MRSRPAPVSIALESSFLDEGVVLAGAFAAQVLVEDEVPDLQVPVADLVGPARRTRRGVVVGAELRATVVVELRARACRAGLTRVPEDLLARQPDDVGGVDADLLERRSSLGVLLPDGHPEPVGVEAEAAGLLRRGEELPGVADRAGLEVVAEGEVAEHLEEGAVAGRPPDALDVVGPDALLRAGCPGPRCRLGPDDVRDERDHARDREQDRGVGRDQRDARDDLVVVLGEVVEVATANLGGAHLDSSDGPRALLAARRGDGTRGD